MWHKILGERIWGKNGRKCKYLFVGCFFHLLFVHRVHQFWFFDVDIFLSIIPLKSALKCEMHRIVLLCTFIVRKKNLSCVCVGCPNSWDAHQSQKQSEREREDEVIEQKIEWIRLKSAVETRWSCNRKHCFENTHWTIYWCLKTPFHVLYMLLECIVYYLKTKTTHTHTNTH